MIKGIGVDIVKIARIKQILEKPYANNFITKVLSAAEQEAFQRKEESRKATFLAGRWASKEAIVKALNLKQLVFCGVTILPKEKNCKIKSPSIGRDRRDK